MLNRLHLFRSLAVVCGLSFASGAAAQEVQIGGRVLLPGKTPFPEAEVTLIPLVDPLTEARQALNDVDGARAQPVAHALTGADGRFVLTAPAAGLWRIRVEAPGFVPQDTRLKPLIERTELPDAELEPDAGFDVRVVDPDGKPVTGARVQVVTDRSRRGFGISAWFAPTRYGTTDAEGAVRLPRADRERLNVAVHASGLAYAERRGLFGTAATVKLQAGRTRSVVVRSKQGQPLAGVVVSLGRDPLAVTRTDDKGGARLTLAGAKETPLSLLADDGRRLETRLPARKTDPDKPDVVTLPARSAVSGRIIDARSRRPVSGGLVWDSENPLISAVAGNQGDFALPGPSGARLRITAGAPGYTNARPREFQLVDDGRPGPTLALQPAAVIEGKVVDAEGQPIAGAEVELRVKRTPGRMRIEIGGPTLAPRAISNARGKFRLSPINPDPSYSVHVEAQGFAPADSSVGALEPYKTKSDLRVEMNRGQTVSGTVVDENGHGLADARITVKPTPSGGHGMMRVMQADELATRFEATTGTEGRFELGGLPARTFDLEATRDGFAKTRVSAVEIAGEPVDLGEIVLAPGENLQGFVTDGDGQPIEGVEVYVREGGPAMMVMMGPLTAGGSDKVAPDAMTDAAGWFRVSDLSAETPVDLDFSRTGYVAGRQAGLRAPRAEPVEVTLNAASKVSGTVVDTEGEPIPGAKVDMTRSKTMEMGGMAMQMMMRDSTTCDADGRFLFEDQEPGDISLAAVASGWQEAKRQGLTIPEGEDLTGIEIPLPAGSIVEGRVMAPDGRAAIGATVNPVSESPSHVPRMGGGTPTDGEGYYRLEGLAPGKASIEASHADYPRVVRDIELKEGINGLTLHFEGGQEVSGRVSDDRGNPLGGAAVRLAAAGRSFGGPEAVTGADGRFEMPGVQDGDYTVFAEAEGFAGSGRDHSITVAGEPVAGVEIQLGRGTAITGNVSGIDATEFSRVSVRAEGPSFGGFEGARVDREGQYRLENLQPGDYAVVASVANSGRQAREQVVLEPGTPEVRVDLAFGGGVTLSGRAVQGEEPVAGATVFASGVDVDHDGHNTTDSEGLFSIDGLEAGRYKVQLQHWKTGLSYTEEVDLGASREIVLEVPTAVVSGRITDAADREPLAGVTVVLEPVEGESSSFRPPHAGTTDLEGQFILDNVGDGNWRMKATKQGYAAVSRTVNVQFQKDPEELKLSMDATEGLTLEARLPSGGIPGELRVAVLDAYGAALTNGTYRTGENGRVRLSSVPPGTWDLIVAGSGSAFSTLRAEAPGATIPVALEPACSLKVEVPDLAGSTAIATVRLTQPDGRPFRALSWSGDPRSEWRMSGGKMEFASLPPGTWTIDVRAGEDKSWQSSATTSPETAVRVIME